MLKIVTDNLGYEFINGEEKVFFPLKIVNRRNIVIENQTKLVNEYINYKGKEWFNGLFELIKEVHTEITFTTSSRLLINVESINSIINYLDVVDMEHWLINIYKVKTPKKLISEFTDEMRADGRWNESQTYTIGDYNRLAAESIRLKILLGPICYYAYLNYSKFNQELIEYTSVRLHLQLLLENNRALNKVNDMVKQFISTVDKQVVIIEKKIPEEVRSNYVTYIAIIQRIATATIVDDTDDKDIINNLYGYCNGKLVNSGDVSKMIRPKITVSNDESGENSSASVLESYKTVTKTTIGEKIQSIWATEILDTCIHNSPDNYIFEDVKDLNKLREILIKFYENPILSRFSIKITKLLFSTTINQKAIDAVPLENIINLMVLGYGYLKKIGYDNIAELYISKEVEFTEISHFTKDKKDKAIYSELNKLYFDFGESDVDNLVDVLTTSNWVNYNGTVEVGKTIVNDLAKLYNFIAYEKYRK